MSEVYQQHESNSGPISHKEPSSTSFMSAEMARFNDGLRQVLSVSKDDLNKLLAKEKARNADRPKRGPKKTNIDVSASSR